MTLFSRLRSFLRNLLRRSEMERQMADELQFHLARRAEDLAARRGLPPAEAARLARLEFGSIEKYKEEARRSHGLQLVDELKGDLRYALRAFARNKGFTAAAVVTLALGIGANTAIFSLMDSIVMRQLPVDRPDELVALRGAFTNPLWEALRDQQDVFAGAFASSSPTRFDLTEGATSRDADVAMVSGDYFRMLGIAPAAGRVLVVADDARGCPAVAVLSHAFWNAQYGGAASAVGATVLLNRQPFRVVGVSAAGFYGIEVGRKFDVAVPLCATLSFDKRNLESRSRWWLTIMGRVRPGITPDALQARLAVLAPSVMRAAAPDSTPAQVASFLETKLGAVPAAGGLSALRRRFQQPLQILMVGVAIVLLIACANIAGLTLARATTRTREMAVRTALGASRQRLIRQLLTESLLLALLGAAAGVFVAKWGAALLVRSLATDRNPLFVEVPLDGKVLGFTAAVAIVTGLLVGLMPALRATKVPTIAALKTRQWSGRGHRSRFFAGRWIVAGQVALSLVLMISGGLLLRTFQKLMTLDAGFDPRNVVVVVAKPNTLAADTVRIGPDQQRVVFEEIERHVRSIPGVVSMARAFTTPIADDNWVTGIATDLPDAPKGAQANAYFNFVAPGYFATLRMSLVAGRDFNEQDSQNSPGVAVVNETLARRFLPGVDPIGRRFRRADDGTDVEIVGIVKDAKYMGLKEATRATAFMPATQAPIGGRAQEFVIRTSSSPSALIPAIQRAMLDVTRDLPLRFQTMEDQVGDNVAQERLLATLAGFFGGLALLLAMVGLYGLLNNFVTHQQLEFGIRMALGAAPSSILRLVLGGVGIVVGAGVAVGLVAAFFSVTLLQQLLFGLEPRDTATMVSAIGLLAAMGALAAYLPALRATRVDPVIVLRSE